MSMTHDDSRGRGISYQAPGMGMAISFRCGRCDKSAGSVGSGVRLVRGIRQKVCRACATAIDAKRRADHV